MGKGSLAVVLRADANPGIGVGHAMRCLALGQAWRDRSARVVLATREGAPGVEARMRDEGIEVFRVEATAGPAILRETVRIAVEVGAAWAVVDGAPVGCGLIDALHDVGCRLAMIDDEGTACVARPDVIVNQNSYAAASLYTACTPATRLLLGPTYALLRREFRDQPASERDVPAVGRKVLVTLGGSDPVNATSLVLLAIESVGVEPLDVIVALGTANVHADAVSRQAAASRVRVRIERDTPRMAELMTWADVAVSSGGSTVWELAFMGLPSLVGSIAPDQRVLVGSSPFFESIGPFTAVTPEALSAALRGLLLDRARRLDQSSRARSVVDGRGCERVLTVLSEIDRTARRPKAGSAPTDPHEARDERE
jgi:UDP-2,4-diacetamido-2,4,6-trideoxy-beta-L-altropyranose hydrolase